MFFPVTETDNGCGSSPACILKLFAFTEGSFLVCCYFENCLGSMLQIVSLTRGSMPGNRGLSAFCWWFSWWCVRNLRLWRHRHDSGYSVRWLCTSWGLSSWVCSWKLICYRFRWSLLERQVTTQKRKDCLLVLTPQTQTNISWCFPPQQTKLKWK